MKTLAVLFLLLFQCGTTRVINDLDQTPWLTCGSCGDSGGSGSLATFSATIGSNQFREDSIDTKFSIAASKPYANAFFYHQLGAVEGSITYLQYQFDLLIPNGDQDSPQAIEFECQQTFGGFVYNMAWQTEYTTGKWRVFNYSTKRWEDSGVTFSRFTSGVWHHVVAEFHTDSTNQTVFHDALTIDGERVPVNISHTAFKSGGKDQFSNAFQLDSNAAHDPYSVYVDRMQVVVSSQ